MVSSLRQEERSILGSCLEALTDTQSEAEEVTDTPSQPEEVQSQQPDVDAVSWRPVDALVFLPVATSEVIGWNWTVWLLMHLSGSAADRGREVAWRPQAHSFHSRCLIAVSRAVARVWPEVVSPNQAHPQASDPKTYYNKES